MVSTHTVFMSVLLAVLLGCAVGAHEEEVSMLDSMLGSVQSWLGLDATAGLETKVSTEARASTEAARSGPFAKSALLDTEWANMGKLYNSTGIVVCTTRQYMSGQCAPKGEVNKASFIGFYTARYGGMNIDAKSKKAYATYLQGCFATGQAMSLPKSVKVLTNHAFRYVGALATAFHFGGYEQDREKLGEDAGRVPTVDTAWFAVAKDSQGFVTKAAFKAFMNDKYAAHLGEGFDPTLHKWVATKRKAYDTYLNFVFDTTAQMSLPAVELTIGEIGFKYACVVGGEFIAF